METSEFNIGKKGRTLGSHHPGGQWVGEAGSFSRFMIDAILTALRIWVLKDHSSAVICVMYYYNFGFASLELILTGMSDVWIPENRDRHPRCNNICSSI